MTGTGVEPGREYFSGARLEVAALVPPGTRSVLDVGCGFGGLAPALRARGVERLYGVERNPEASPHLERAYDRFWIGDVERVEVDPGIAPLDCVVFADVLEHLADPWRVLTRFVELLRPDGLVVASIPNVRNLALLYQVLVRGRWTYGPSGLLDRGHLRFFTRSEIEDMLAGAGLVLERIDANRDSYGLVRRILTVVPRMLVPDLEVCQFLVVARKAEGA